MSRATPDDQLKFLLSCVKHSNNGRIDFVEVACECGIVSKGAAAKRYERLMKANGIHPNGAPPEKAVSQSSLGKSKSGIAKAAEAKKRKLEEYRYDLKENDEEEMKPVVPKVEISIDEHIKPEPNNAFAPYAFPQMVMAPTAPYFPRTMPLGFPNYELSSQLSSVTARENGPMDYSDESIFNEFCNPNAFSRQALEESRFSLPSQAETISALPPEPQDVVLSTDNLANKETSSKNTPDLPNIICISD